MKLALTGTTGVGKTTLANALSQKCSIPIISENFEPLISSLVAFNSSSNELQAKERMLLFLQNCDKWLKERTVLQSQYDSFVEDRLSFDIVGLLMTSRIGQQRPDILKQLIELSAKQSAIYDLVIVLPLGDYSFEESLNEYGLSRKTNFCDKVKYQSMSIGLLEQFCAAPKLYIQPSCKTVSQRVDYVISTLETLRVAKMNETTEH